MARLTVCLNCIERLPLTVANLIAGMGDGDGDVATGIYSIWMGRIDHKLTWFGKLAWGASDNLWS